MWDLIRKIFLALVIAGLLGLVLYCAYGAEYKVGDTITLQMFEIDKVIEGDGREYTKFNVYSIQREIIKSYKVNQYQVVHIRLKREDLDSDKFIFCSKAKYFEIKRKSLLAIAQIEIKNKEE